MPGVYHRYHSWFRRGIIYRGIEDGDSTHFERELPGKRVTPERGGVRFVADRLPKMLSVEVPRGSCTYSYWERNVSLNINRFFCAQTLSRNEVLTLPFQKEYMVLKMLSTETTADACMLTTPVRSQQ